MTLLQVPFDMIEERIRNVEKQNKLASRKLDAIKKKMMKKGLWN